MRTKYKIVARKQGKLDKFIDTIAYGLILGATVNPYEVVKIVPHGNIFNLKQAVDDYNYRFTFLEEPIQLLEVL